MIDLDFLKLRQIQLESDRTLSTMEAANNKFLRIGYK